MKKPNLFILLFLSIIIFSCSKDDSNGSFSDDIDPEGVNVKEEVLLDINATSSGIAIEGATLNDGGVTPTGGVDFSLDYTSQTAFQDYGFEIIFDAPTDFAGAYIQLFDENGMADSYIDVPSSATEAYYGGKFLSKERKDIFTKKGASTQKDEDTVIDVNFSNTVPAGTFCYAICVYDSQGNISQPVEVCVTVESWGGNVNLVGDWDFTKQIDNGETIAVGEETCESYDSTLNCDNGTQREVELDECYTLNNLLITFNENGTYFFSQESNYKSYDYAASNESCEVIYEEDGGEAYTSSGNWAFNEEENILTLVEFEYTETGDGETYTDVEPDGYLLLEGEIRLSANELIISESDTFNGETELYEYFFSKK
ncbi:hypothetical protein [uncultured Maribacter sp.]|uniref:hypothetical protein n=1 Tax=uncultured Maribacter sp. TaxID=431308 RepID=UPI002626150F|nr:hypothetical protein [uncultured Maribacter sp.]